jgi:uncharacterized protein (DUF983 family)
MTEPTIFQSTFFARCPRCGRAPVYAGYLKIAPRCTACGLDFSQFDVGDGATVFVILFTGIIVAGGALAVEVKYSPPYWVHAIIWLPAILVLVLGGLHVVKTLLLVLQYKHQAREGRLEK